ncbi:outer membrane beta-barrel protein [Flavobacterium helocola]|uniref:Outer membrane beta-barrel protein n=1 Tax=Flavobacterium helocola TaxID=3139139 RepID=A0ABU9I9E5_9FLAO
MKKVLLSAVALLAFGFANAQEEKSANGGFAKGDVFVSGSFGIASDKAYDADLDFVESTGFSFMPKVGFFVTENIAVGGKLGFASMKAEVEGVDVEETSELSLGAFGRYYMTPASQFSVFAELGLDYNSTDYKLADLQKNGFGANLGLGLSYFVSSNFALEAGVAVLGFNSEKFDVDGAETESSFGLGADLTNVSLGVVYKF